MSEEPQNQIVNCAARGFGDDAVILVFVDLRPIRSRVDHPATDNDDGLPTWLVFTIGGESRRSLLCSREFV